MERSNKPDTWQKLIDVYEAMARRWNAEDEAELHSQPSLRYSRRPKQRAESELNPEQPTENRPNNNWSSHPRPETYEDCGETSPHEAKRGAE